MIKFSDKATIEHLNVDIKEKIEVAKLRGGGTSFIKPLEKLDQILMQVEKEVFIPIVFFLSDGFGEKRESVFNYCKKINEKFKNMDLLFFSVGYGDVADAETLEGIARIFNKDLSILSVGNEMCKLYHHVKNEKKLLEVFSLFEKLFKYQNNLMESKKSQFQECQLEQTKIKESSSEAIEAIYQLNKNLEERELKDIEIKSKTLDEVNKEFDDAIVQANKKIEELNKATESIQHEEKIERVEMEKLENSITEVDFEQKKNNLEELKKKFESIKNNERELMFQQVTNIQKNKDDIFETHLNSLKEKNVDINDSNKRTYKLIFQNFTKSVHEYSLYRDNIEEYANKIKNEFDQVINQLKLLNETLVSFREDSNSENLKNKIWEMVKFYYRKRENFDDNLTDYSFLKELLNLKLKKDDDDNIDEVKLALDLIMKYVSSSELFSKMESTSNYIDSFSENIKDDLKAKIREKNTKITELEKDRERNREKIEKEEKEIDDIENSKDKYEDNRQEIKKILNCLNGVRMQVKEIYIKENLLKDLHNTLKAAMGANINNIHQLKIEHTKNSN